MIPQNIGFAGNAEPNLGDTKNLSKKTKSSLGVICMSGEQNIALSVILQDTMSALKSTILCSGEAKKMIFTATNANFEEK